MPSKTAGKILVITGPTACGKTDLAIALVRRFPHIEIINADSLLVYRGMDIGTAKPPRPILNQFRHHLIDIRDPNEGYTAADFVREVSLTLEDIDERDGRAVIVGGTGFYLRALFFGVWDAPPTDPQFRREAAARDLPELHAELRRADPEFASQIASQDRYRITRALEIIHAGGPLPSQLDRVRRNQMPDPRYSLAVVDRDPQDREARIASRTRSMMEAGWVEETRSLLEQYPQSRALASVGYAQIVDHLRGVKPPGRHPRPGQAGLEDEINLATRQLVKAQRTWIQSQYVRVKDQARFLFEKDRAAWEDLIQHTYGN